MTQSQDHRESCDLLVAGSGASGLAAAVTAAHLGLKVIVAEKADVLGGTSAWSGGWIWAPRNPVVKAHGVNEDPAAPRRYLEAVLGNNANPELLDAFLAAAPEMVGFFEENTALKFDPGLHIPDTYGHLPGAGTGGRSVIARRYDGRELGADIGLLRPPLRETSFWGMTIQAGPDLKAFMTASRSMSSALYAARRLGRHVFERAFHGRGMQLRNGNALIARLIRSAIDAGVEFRTGHEVAGLETDGGFVTGAILKSLKGGLRIDASRGVVLASGGFANDRVRRGTDFPFADTHRTLAVPEASGDGVRMGEETGGSRARSLASHGPWCPVSEVTWPDGSKGVFPHIIDRGKPGVVGVLRDGARFCNEGMGYHDYVTALIEATPDEGTPESWLICDHRFIRRYGLGIVRPAPVPMGAWLKSGYLKAGGTVTELAAACGIDREGLAKTISKFNADAERGEDTEFGRGTSPYMRLQGDPEIGPNPCMAPIVKPPFFAVRVIPGSFGTFSGLRTDGFARVLDDANDPIQGLYAVGNDMASVMGGHYPAGGINLGPALTFGFVAGRHAAGGAS